MARMFVLIAHDDREFRRRLGLGIKSRGCQVAAIPDLSGVLQVAADLKPDVLLVEPRLLSAAPRPLARCVSEAAGKTVAVVVLSYWAGPEQAAFLREHGATLLAARPEDHDALVLQLRQMVPRSTAPSPPWETGPTPAPAPNPARPSALSADWLFAETGGDAESARPESAAVFLTHDAKGTGPRVLIVDDDPTFRLYLCESLADNGFRTYFSTNASNALRALRSCREIDVVVSDLHMPHMDGFEFKEELDRLSDALIPFLMLTADPSPENQEIARRVGAHALIGKPILDTPAFVRAIHQAIASIPTRPS